MRQKSLSLILLAALLSVVVFVVGTSARVFSDDSQDLSEWTMEQYNAFLSKCNIPLPDNNDDVASTVRYYKDKVAANAAYFGSKVDKITNNVRVWLQKQKGLAENDIDDFVAQLEHRLRRLELQGDLSRDRVAETLDRWQNKALKKKIMTDAQWRYVYNDVVSSFDQRQSWYQSVIHRKTNDASDSLNRFLQSIKDGLMSSLSLTEQQARSVVDALRSSLVSTHDLSKIGDKHWNHHLRHELKKNAKLQKNQIDQIMGHLEKEINAYRIFAVEYVGDKYTSAQEWADDLAQHIKGSGRYSIDRVYDLLHAIDATIRSYLPLSLGGLPAPTPHHDSSYDTVRSAVSSVASDWRSSASAAHASKESLQAAAASSASSFGAHITEAVEDIPSNFANYWYEKEKEFYRRMGYTEAQIDWVQKYLAKTFSDQKALTKADVDHVVQTVRHYLEDAQIQTQAQVQHQIDQLHLLIEQWKHSICRKTGQCNF
ncbi:hypothetical protein BX666DRAFT_1884398 [Dichotomocladium elegans]|nr:hypothetical protein BX666DRAFT_1884398 [Dichotomocladium elegans]